MMLLQGDCLELMNDIPDKSIDLILCDLPYGILGETPPSTWKNKEKIATWDKVIDTEELFKHYGRILKENGRAVLFCQGEFVADLITHSNNIIQFSQKLIWLKNSPGNILGCKKQFVNYYEDICVFNKPGEDNQINNFIGDILLEEIQKNGKTKKDVYNLVGSTASHYFSKGKQFRIPTEKRFNELQKNGFITSFDYQYLIDLQKPSQKALKFNLLDGEKMKSNVLEFPKETNTVHPTQKPVALLEYLIKTYTNEGDLVLDNCMGSGSTGVACVNTNRDFIGMELNEEYFKIACERIEGAN